jgi:hypothetical protein
MLSIILSHGVAICFERAGRDSVSCNHHLLTTDDSQESLDGILFSARPRVFAAS